MQSTNYSLSADLIMEKLERIPENTIENLIEWLTELGIICLCRADYFYQRQQWEREVKEYLKWNNYRTVHRELMEAWAERMEVSNDRDRNGEFKKSC